jgi:hypothetical protein
MTVTGKDILEHTTINEGALGGQGPRGGPLQHGLYRGEDADDEILKENTLAII